MPTKQALALSSLHRREAWSPQLQSGRTLESGLPLTEHTEVGATGTPDLFASAHFAPV